MAPAPAGDPLGRLQRLSYHPALVGITRRLGLRRPLSRAYFWWRRPADSRVRVALDGADGVFEVRTPWQLRWLESVALGTDLDPDLRAMLSALGPGDVAYDVGANLGLFTVLLARVVGPTGLVVAFEPQSKAFEHLEGNVRLNALCNVRAFRLGLGEHAGCAVLELNERTVLSRLASPNGGTEREPIEVVAGDEFRRLAGLPIPAAVKIDVEGAECGVIQGLRDTLADARCRLLCCELHPSLLPRGVTTDAVLTLIRSLGFDDTNVHPFDGWAVAVCRKGSRKQA